MLARRREMPPAAVQEVARAWLDEWRAAEVEARVETAGKMSFRSFLESSDFARPYLAATGYPDLSEAFGAIVDAAEGRPIQCSAELCQRLFRCGPHQLPKVPRRIVAISAGGRSGKTSRLLAPKGVHAAWTVEIPTLAPNERAVALLVAPKKKLAKKTFDMVIGVLQSSPVLRAAIVGEPRTNDVTLRRPDGKLVTIEVGVADQQGQDARGSVYVFVGMDEAAFFRTKDGDLGADRGILDAAESRLAPGAQIWIVSTPWIEGVGELEGFVENDWGKHVSALVVARVDTRTLNPHWDPTGDIEASLRRRAGGDEVADREIWAKPLPKGTLSWFDPIAVAECLELRVDGQHDVYRVGAGSDLGFRQDGSSLALLNAHTSGMLSGILVRDIRPRAGQPLVPSVVCVEFAVILGSYGASSVTADRVYAESFREPLAQRRIALLHPEGSVRKRFERAREIFFQRRIALGHLPAETREEIRVQLLAVRYKPRPGKEVEIILPRTKATETSGGSHGDAVTALVNAIWAVGQAAGDVENAEHTLEPTAADRVAKDVDPKLPRLDQAGVEESGPSFLTELHGAGPRRIAKWNPYIRRG